MSCGEFVLTLEDVMMLTSLPVFGNVQVSHFKLSEKDNMERYNALMSFLQKTKYGASKKATYLTWASYFVDGTGKNEPFQFEAFLAY